MKSRIIRKKIHISLLGELPELMHLIALTNKFVETSNNFCTHFTAHINFLQRKKEQKIMLQE